MPIILNQTAMTLDEIKSDFLDENSGCCTYKTMQELMRTKGIDKTGLPVFEDASSALFELMNNPTGERAQACIAFYNNNTTKLSTGTALQDFDVFRQNGLSFAIHFDGMWKFRCHTSSPAVVMNLTDMMEYSSVSNTEVGDYLPDYTWIYRL